MYLFIRTGNAEADEQNQSSFNFEKQKNSDFYLLGRLNVKYIFDLMVESHKKAYGVRVTSSEKAEKSRYFGISINAVPYPGCEFFKIFKTEKNRNAEELFYDWSLDFVNANLSIDSQIQDKSINWNEYKTWNLSKFSLCFVL